MAGTDGGGRKRRVIVVGAGIVGACVAFELVKRGAQVVLVDLGKPERACSFGNSGAISPGSVVPLATPRLLASVPRMLLDSESPIRLPLAYVPRALPWLLKFALSATPKRIEATAEALQALNADAVKLHTRLAAEIGAPGLVVQRGQLHVYPDWAALQKDEPSWLLRESLGVRFDRLNRAGVVSLEPNVGPRYTFGIYLPDQAMVVNPNRYVQEIVKAFSARGGALVTDRINSLRHEAYGGWSCHGDGGRLDGDHVVVAAGAWSGALLRPLGIVLPLESQRGYHVTFKGAYAPVSRTVVLADRRVFATPMEEGLRVGGTVEFGGLKSPPNFERSAMLARFAREAFPGLAGGEEHHWMGHRPCTPDSLPHIGAAPGKRGLWIATGHGHLGLTGSVKTSHIIADQLLRNP